MKKLLIIDSNSLINRAFYGVRFLSSRDGTPTNAIYGFMMTLLKLLDDFKPDYICAAFDLKAPTFRHKMYKEYKAQRKPMPDGLKTQMPIAKDILRTMGINILEKEGYEADDIIGTISKICDENDVECLIATGDKDDLQLASEKTKVLLTVTKSGLTETDVYDDKKVFERYGVTPTEFIDVKALMGDTSDNIPGVRGIGEKTAMTIISKAKSIENLYDNLDNFGITPANIKKLQENKDMALLSKVLATIDRNVPVEFDFDENSVCDYSKAEGLYEALKKLDLNKIIDRIGLTKTTEEKEAIDFLEGTSCQVIDNEAALDTFIEKVRNAGRVSCIFETKDEKLTALCAAVGKEACCIPVLNGLKEKIFELLADEKIEKYSINVKEAMLAADIRGVKYDIALAAYLLNPARSHFTINDLAFEYLGFEFGEAKQMSLFDDADIDNARRVLAIMPIYEITQKQLAENGQQKLYYDIELPLSEVLADMQKEGILVDREKLFEFSEEIKEKIDFLVDKIYLLAGGEFNINSTQQLGAVLFEKLGLKAIKKTKRGYSTNAEVLEKLRGKHEIIEYILEYRKLSKLKSTYCDGLLAVINEKTGRIHSVFNQTVTVTGRISSTEPNMQNIPTRTEIGSTIRKMFVAREGCVLIDADYSQIELRVLSHIANDEVMKNAFLNNEDIHTVTASQVLGKAPEDVTKEERSSAKAVNFGIVYGMGEFSLAQDLKISVKEAKQYIESYLEKYSGVKEYMAGIKETAKRDGYVKTLLNRIRYIPELSSSNFMTRSFGERVALNTPIQGTAADIIKLAMVRIFARLREEGLKSKLILQVHDELIIEAPMDEVEKAKKILVTEMENAIKLSIPLKACVSEGKSWYDAK